MTIDIDKCIGSGNCVRACKEENDVPDEDGCFRTWVERYRVDPDGPGTSARRLAARWHRRFRADRRTDQHDEDVLVPKMCNHCVDSPCTQVCPVGATFHSPDGVVLIDKTRCLGCRYCVQACPYGVPLHRPAARYGRQVHALLSPHHEGPDDGVREVCPTGARQLVDLKNPRIPCTNSSVRTRFTCSNGDGHQVEGLLQRARRLGR